jgi:hypothetical protein
MRNQSIVKKKTGSEEPSTGWRPETGVRTKNHEQYPRITPIIANKNKQQRADH